MFLADERTVRVLGNYPPEGSSLQTILNLPVRVVQDRVGWDNGEPIYGNEHIALVVNEQTADSLPDLFTPTGFGYDAQGNQIADAHMGDNEVILWRLLTAFQQSAGSVDAANLVATVVQLQTQVAAQAAQIAGLAAQVAAIKSGGSTGSTGFSVTRNGSVLSVVNGSMAKATIRVLCGANQITSFEVLPGATGSATLTGKCVNGAALSVTANNSPVWSAIV